MSNLEQSCVVYYVLYDWDLEENSPSFLLPSLVTYPKTGISSSIVSEKPCHYSYSETGALYQQFDAQFPAELELLFPRCSTAICNLMVGISFYRQNRQRERTIIQVSLCVCLFLNHTKGTYFSGPK